MESRFLVVVLARIYSDTSPPKKASFLPPLSFGFQRTCVMKVGSAHRSSHFKQIKLWIVINALHGWQVS